MRMPLILLAALPTLLAPALATAQPAPPPPAPQAYPVCTHPGQDSCQNPGEGGAPGRSRASDYPGGPPAHGSDMMMDHSMMDHSMMNHGGSGHHMARHRHMQHHGTHHHAMHRHHKN